MKASRYLLLMLLATMSLVPATSRASGADDMRLLAVYDLAGAGSDIAWSPDGSKLAATSGDNIAIMNPSNGEIILTMAPGNYLVRSVGWSPDGSRLAFCAGALPFLAIWNATDATEPAGTEHRGAMHFAWSPHGNIASDWGDLASYNISVWSASTGTHIRSIPTNDSSVGALDFSPDGGRLAAILDGKAIIIWDLTNGRAASIDGTGWYGNATALSWSPDGRYLLVGMDDPVGHFNIRLFDGLTLESVGGSSYSQSGTLCTAWSPDGTTIATGQRDGSVMLTGFDADWIDARPLGNHTGAVTSLSWSPDGKLLASASPDGTVRLWGLPDALPKSGLVLSLAAERRTVLACETLLLSVRLVDGRQNPVPGASLSFSSTGGGSFSAVSDSGGGNYTVSFTAPAVPADTTVNLTVTATRAGFAPVIGSLELSVLPPPANGRVARPGGGGHDAGPVAVVAGGVVLVVLAALAISETGRYSALVLFIPLFTRVKKAAVLDNFSRGMLQGYIIANPGVHMSAIRHRFNLSNGEVAYHLRVLEREGYISSTTDGLKRRFYPGERIDLQDRPQELSVAENLLVSFMEKFPGITGTELARLARTTPQVVNYHLKKLWRMEVISMDRDGRVVRCRVRPEGLRLFRRRAVKEGEVGLEASPAD